MATDPPSDIGEAPGSELPSAPSAGHALRSAGWAVADQGVYSLTNLVLTVLVATSVDAERFGAFSVVYVSYLVIYGLVDGSVAEVFTLQYSGTKPREWRPALAAASGAALALSLVVTGLCLALAAALGGPTGEALTAFAVVLPALLLQALWRSAFFAAGRPRDAVFNDMLWALAQVAAIAAVVTADPDPSVAALVGAWGVGALVGTIAGCIQLRVLPSPRGAVPWLREHSHLGLRFSSEFLVLYGSSQVVLLALGPWAGLAEVGALRGAQVLFGPIQALLLSMRFALLPVFVRTNRAEPGRLLPRAVVVSTALAAGALVWGLALFGLPDDIGEALLGDSWLGARAVIPAMALQVVALGALFGAFTGLRARAQAADTLRIGMGTATMGLVLGLAGAWSTGATGAQWGVSAAVAVGVVRLWHRFLARDEVGGSPEEGDAENRHEQQRPEVGHGGLQRTADNEDLEPREHRDDHAGELRDPPAAPDVGV
jgi:O-antigen/teichoic acid export membrane protein